MINAIKNEDTKETIGNVFNNPTYIAIKKELMKLEILKDKKFLDWVFSQDHLFFINSDLKKEDIDEEESDNNNISKLDIFISIVFHYAKMNKKMATIVVHDNLDYKSYYYLKYNNNYYKIGSGYFINSEKYYIFCERISAKNKKYIDFTDIQNNSNKNMVVNQNVTNLVELIFALAKEDNIPFKIIKETADKVIEVLLTISN